MGAALEGVEGSQAGPALGRPAWASEGSRRFGLLAAFSAGVGPLPVGHGELVNDGKQQMISHAVTLACACSADRAFRRQLGGQTRGLPDPELASVEIQKVEPVVALKVGLEGGRMVAEQMGEA